MYPAMLTLSFFDLRSFQLSTTHHTAPIGKSPGQRGVGNAELADLDHGTHDAASECAPHVLNTVYCADIPRCLLFLKFVAVVVHRESRGVAQIEPVLDGKHGPTRKANLTNV